MIFSSMVETISKGLSQRCSGPPNIRVLREMFSAWTPPIVLMLLLFAAWEAVVAVMDISFICWPFHLILCLYSHGGYGYFKFGTPINGVELNSVDSDDSDLDSLACSTRGIRHK